MSDTLFIAILIDNTARGTDAIQHTVAGTSRDDAIGCMKDEFIAIYGDDEGATSRWEAIESAARDGAEVSGDVFSLAWRQLR